MREHLLRKKTFSLGIAQITSPPSPQFWQVVQLFLDVKYDVLTRFTESSNNDYDNDGSNNCDYNFGTFDDFGVKNEQKVSHYMILMSKYKGQHGGKEGKKIRARHSPPPFRAMPERKHFFYRRASLMRREPKIPLDTTAPSVSIIFWDWFS